MPLDHPLKRGVLHTCCNNANKNKCRCTPEPHSSSLAPALAPSRSGACNIAPRVYQSRNYSDLAFEVFWELQAGAAAVSGGISWQYGYRLDKEERAAKNTLLVLGSTLP